MRRLAALLSSRALAALAATLLLAGCSGRERSNPLDPANALTGGAPQGFVALAADHSAELRWAASTSQLPLAYRLTRAAGSAPAESLTTLAPEATQYFDSGLTNGIDYTYRLSYVLGNGILGYATFDIATPGPARAWVVDSETRSLQRITADGRHVAEVLQGRFREPNSVDALADNVAFVCDPSGGQLWRVYTHPNIQEEVGSLVQPVAAVVDRDRNRLWVADKGRGALLSLDPINPLSPYVNVPNLALPTDVAIDIADGSAWVSERTGGQVRRVSFTGSTVATALVANPARVAVDSLTRNLWVVSFAARRLSVFSSIGAPLDSIGGFSGPLGIAIDSRRGHVWIADVNGGRMVVFDRNRARLFEVTGLLEPLDAAIDLNSGDAWVVLAGGRQVVRIAADGTIKTRLGGFYRLKDIALAH